MKVKVWGEYALFSRPEMKVERCSYDVMTPSAARGILEAIYWHPGMRWVIDRIYVNKPIQFTSVRRNEVKNNTSKVITKKEPPERTAFIIPRTRAAASERGQARNYQTGHFCRSVGASCRRPFPAPL